MIEVTGDFWQYKADWRIIPTNGVVSNGRLIMGAGLALDAKRRYRGIDRELGEMVHKLGNRPFHAMKATDCAVFSFPTKRHWAEVADLTLIAQSAQILRSIYDEWTNWDDDDSPPIVLFPHVGCGMRTGQLKWPQVKPILDKVFPEENFIAIAQG